MKRKVLSSTNEDSVKEVEGASEEEEMSTLTEVPLEELVKEKEKHGDQATTTTTVERKNEDLVSPESRNEDYENLAAKRFSRHRHRVNPWTFKEFFMKLWRKHNGDSHRVAGELILALVNMGYR